MNFTQIAVLSSGLGIHAYNISFTLFYDEVYIFVVRKSD